MDTYFLTYHIFNIIFYCLFGLSAFLLLFKLFLHILSFMPAKKFAPAKTNHRYAIVIPARNESKVIRQILESIKKQTYPADLLDIYIIVEREDDPTCEIAKEFERTHVFVRKHLERKGKGHAMDELFQELLKDESLEYEAYFIFDADNILYPNFIEEMNKSFDAGYDVAISYRNSKNWNDGWIASCSGLTFAIFNVFDSRPKSRLGLNVSICGTGFYLSAKLLKQVGGYKFFTLTEDYELRLFSALNNVPTTYNERAKFYDEQPTKMKASWNQRMRWCKGFLQANKIYNKKLLKSGIKQKGRARVSQLLTVLGVVPLIVTVATIASYQVVNLIMMIIGLAIHSPIWYLPLIGFGASALALYIFLMLYTLMLLIIDRKNIKLKPLNYIICLFMNPIFILLYIPIYFSAMFKKDVEWVAIEHTKVVDPTTGEILDQEKKIEQEEKHRIYEKLKAKIKSFEQKRKNKSK